jgi:hypothetical protein
MDGTGHGKSAFITQRFRYEHSNDNVLQATQHFELNPEETYLPYLKAMPR